MSEEPVRCPACGAEISPKLAGRVIAAQRKIHSGGRRPLKTGPVSKVTEWRRRKKAEAEAKKPQPRK